MDICQKKLLLLLMSAITGIIDTQHHSSETIVQQMLETMRHRGTKAAKHKFVETATFQIGLGHRHSFDEAQFFETDTLWISFDGEIYNHPTIREELQKIGHQLDSNTLVETILHAYKEWGEKCLDKFRGMFAFTIIDIEKKEVFCVRDRAGVKPFFFYLKKGLFLFSSELKAFHQHPEWERTIDLSAVEMFMQFGNVPAPSTIFENTFKLKPGHYLKFNIKELIASPTLTQHQYWNVYDSYNQPKLTLPFEEAKQQTERLLLETLELRMRADAPVGVFLSGGFDSASVVALLQKERTEKLKTFTIAVPDIGLNEAPYAKDVSNHLGTDHTEYECSHQEVIDLIDDLPYYYDEPFGDSSAIPTSLVAKVARKYVPIAISADAGDEVFAGYNRYDYLMKYGAKLNQIPSFARQIIAGTMGLINADSIPYFKNKYNFANRYEKLKSLLRDPSPEQMMWSLSSQFDEAGLNRLLKQRVKLPSLAYHSKELSEASYSPLNFMMAVDYQTYLPDDVLTKVDRAMARFDLQGREPYLDHKVIEWAATLPDAYKYHNGIKKYILREIVHQYIPRELMDRPKMGFAIPFEKWMQEDLRERLEDFLSEERIQQQNIFNSEEINRIKKQFFAGKKEYGLKLWYILMFQMWYERWMK